MADQSPPHNSTVQYYHTRRVNCSCSHTPKQCPTAGADFSATCIADSSTSCPLRIAHRSALVPDRRCAAQRQSAPRDTDAPNGWEHHCLLNSPHVPQRRPQGLRSNVDIAGCRTSYPPERKAGIFVLAYWGHNYQHASHTCSCSSIRRMTWPTDPKVCDTDRRESGNDPGSNRPCRRHTR